MVGRSVPKTKYTSHKKMTAKISKSAPGISTSRTAPSRQRKEKKDVKLHDLIFEEGGLLDGTEVTYDCNKKLGYKTSCGILCSCCKKNLSPSKFEAHAGMGSRRKPFVSILSFYLNFNNFYHYLKALNCSCTLFLRYSYIHLKNNISLHRVSLYLRKRHSVQDSGKHGADDEKRLLCDGCRSFFYKDSASSAMNLPGNWHCKLCSDPIDRTAVSETCDARNQEEDTQCFLCRGVCDCNFQFCRHTLVVCHQCEKEYHTCCLNRNKMSDLKVKPKGKWFCCPDCKSISSHLRTVIEAQQKEFTDSLLEPKRKRLNNNNKTVRWRLLLCAGTTRKDILLRDELLSQAYTILKGRFNDVVDSDSGRDHIHDMFYRKNGQHSVYCAVVTVDSSVVAAGVLRVLGRNIAELPLAATDVDSQGQGYFRRLISGIEDVLKECRVHRFVLSATKEAEPMWINKFGFTEMSEEQGKYYEENCWRMLYFWDATLLQKVIDGEPSSNLSHPSDSIS